MDLERLRVLRALADHGTLTAAAEALAYTQPSVSRQLAALEREVGVQLVERGPRAAVLTPAGEALLAHADTLLPALDGALREVRGFADPDGGVVRLGALPSAVVRVVPDALARLRAQRPRVEVRLTEGWSPDLVADVRRGALDLAVVTATAAALGADPSLPAAAGAGSGAVEVEELAEEPYVLLLPAGHRLARRGTRRPRLADTADEPWLAAPDPAGRRALLDLCAAVGFTPRIVGTTGQWSATERLVAAGAGVALVPALALGGALHPGVVARTPHDVAPRTLAVVRATGRWRPPAADALVAALRRAAGATPGP